MSARTLPQPVAPYGISIVGEFYMEVIADPAQFEEDRYSWTPMKGGGIIHGRLPNGEQRILAYLIEWETQQMGLTHQANTLLEAKARRRRAGFLFT